MKVELLAITPKAEELIAQAYGICTGKNAIPLENIAKYVDIHPSPIEHPSCSFRIEGISRACSHQLVRHRLCSFSQESMRYVSQGYAPCVIPDSIKEKDWVYDTALDHVANAFVTYELLIMEGIAKEDARFVLPIATETKLLMTFNFREALHIFRLRISPHAQWEIREVCVWMLELLYPHAPVVFGGLREELMCEYPTFFEAKGRRE